LPILLSSDAKKAEIHSKNYLNVEYLYNLWFSLTERERERIEEKKQREAEKTTSKVSAEIPESTTLPSPAINEVEPAKELKIEVHATAVHHEQLQPVVAHAQAHEISHEHAGFSIRRLDSKESSSVYVTLGFAGIALVAAMLVGVVVMKKRNGRHPHHQGFVEVDQTASPEERHVANMQMNGYENPTYKYFEASA